MKKINDFYGFIDENEYVIDGVFYKDSSSFAPVNILKIENTISDKVQKYIGSDFTHQRWISPVRKDGFSLKKHFRRSAFFWLLRII